MKKHFSIFACLFLLATVFQSCKEVNGPCLDNLPEPFASISGKGHITIDAVGGEPPYRYALDTIPFGDADSNFFWKTSYPDAEYNIGVKDANGCIKWVIQDLDKTPGCKDPNFTDPRDQNKYCTVLIGNRLWFQQNLNFADNNTYCFKTLQSNCELYGRLYTYSKALTACPSGWHLPNLQEWNELITLAGGFNNSVALAKLTAGGSLGFEALATERRNDVISGASNEYSSISLPGDNSYYWVKDSIAGNVSVIKFSHESVQKIELLNGVNPQLAHSCRCIEGI